MTEATQLSNSVLVQGASLADIERMVQRAIDARLDAFVKAIQPKPDPLVKRVDAAKMLGVSLPTLDKYGQFGILHPRRCGGRVYYAQSELEKYLYNNKKG